MVLYGTFVNKKGSTIGVYIYTKGDTSTEVEIGASGTVWFSDDPVEIESQVNDTFDVLRPRQATVRLLCRDYIPDLYCSNPRDARVMIRRDDAIVFAGYIEPQAYSQDYNSLLDEVELSCIDVISTLSYRKYDNAGAKGVDFRQLRQQAGVKTFGSVITSILKGYSDELSPESKIYYDGSKAIDSTEAKRYSIFSDIAVNELLFLDEDEDSVWGEDEVVEELLRYLNLHIEQVGIDFYIFSWESLRSGKPVAWHTLDGVQAATETPGSTVISLDIAEDDATAFSVGETYSQIKLSCDVKNVEQLVESPLDDSDITSPYRSKQRYCDEILAKFKDMDGSGMTIAALPFNGMLAGLSYDYDKASMYKWFVQVKQSSKWSIGRAGQDYIAKFCADGRNQQALLERMRTEIAGALVSLGNVEIKANKQDNSPVASVNMTDYLVISVNGNGVDQDTSGKKVFPSADDLLAASPIATYTGNNSGAVLTPPDKDTTNYIVISGSVLLNPLKTSKSGTEPAPYKVMQAYVDQYCDKSKPFGTTYWYHVPGDPVEVSDGDYKQMWWTSRFYSADTPLSPPSVNADMSALLPPSSVTAKRYEFNYSAIGDSDDHISKVAVLACMLIVGDKCVVETGTEGKPGDYTWQTYKERSQCASDDEYYQQSFTIGINPKIGDYLVGEEHKVQNNIDYTMGLDVEGTAIPIKFGSGISGRVQFMILGPVNSTWNNVTRRHKTWFRHTKWSTNDVALMAHVSSIFIKKLEVKIHSDNGFNSNDSNDELVYMSDTASGFQNRKQDISFKLCTALTAAERAKYGITDTVLLSAPQKADGTALLSIYDVNKAESAKPEQDYIDSYYNEYCTPKVLLTQAVTDKQLQLSDHYTQQALGKSFYIQSVSRNMMDGVATLTLKEL